ncbi:hypothetical protein OIM90_05100 [Streptomyces sp. AD16]|nr:hypothetical protein OIM90_05100 [Streptomyces sp. AD16]
MGKQRYDQRVRAFVEVRGGEADWELAGERFAAHGWPVRDSVPAGAGPLGDAVETRPDSRVYEIEVRLPGIAKGADLGAARRVAKALRAARVEGYVRRTDVLHRDRETPRTGGRSTRGPAPARPERDPAASCTARGSPSATPTDAPWCTPRDGRPCGWRARGWGPRRW